MPPKHYRSLDASKIALHRVRCLAKPAPCDPIGTASRSGRTKSTNEWNGKRKILRFDVVFFIWSNIFYGHKMQRSAAILVHLKQHTVVWALYCRKRRALTIPLPSCEDASRMDTTRAAYMIHCMIFSTRTHTHTHVRLFVQSSWFASSSKTSISNIESDECARLEGTCRQLNWSALDVKNNTRLSRSKKRSENETWLIDDGDDGRTVSARGNAWKRQNLVVIKRKDKCWCPYSRHQRRRRTSNHYCCLLLHSSQVTVFGN